MIVVRKHGSRRSGKTAALVAAAVCFSIAQLGPAWADYEHAKIHFDGLDADSRRLIGLGLIGTGDYDGLLESGFTKPFYHALSEFQMREGFAPDGDLDGGEFDRLKNRSADFYDPLGLRYYIHPYAASKLLVPRLAFDSETRTPRGFAFERYDKSLSLSFVAYPASEKSFGQLYDSMTTSSEQRKVVYRKRRDHYFVSSGFYRERHYYTWIRATQGGSTGFTLSWTSPLKDLGSRLSIVLANSFVSGDTDNATVFPSSQPAPAEPDAQDETSKQPTGAGFEISHDAQTDPVDVTSSVDSDVGIHYEYWRRPKRSRIVEIKGYDFVFTPIGDGRAGTVKGGSALTQSHRGKYEVLRNDPGNLAMKVNIGNDEPAHANDINATLEIQGENATLTGTLEKTDVRQLTEAVEGDGSEKHPFLIEFSKGSLKWR